MIAKGEYRARALRGDFGISPEKQTPYVRVAFQILDEPFAGDEIAWDGYFTDGTEDRTVEALQFTGCKFPGGDVTNLTGLGTKTNRITVTHEEYTVKKTGEQKTIAKVAWVNDGAAWGVADEQKMPPAAKKSLAERMKAKLAIKP